MLYNHSEAERQTGTSAKCPSRHPKIHFNYLAQCTSGAEQHFQLLYLSSISLTQTVISSHLLFPSISDRVVSFQFLFSLFFFNLKKQKPQKKPHNIVVLYRKCNICLLQLSFFKVILNYIFLLPCPKFVVCLTFESNCSAVHSSKAKKPWLIPAVSCLALEIITWFKTPKQTVNIDLHCCWHTGLFEDN